jgi:hypothetical protein
VRRPFREAAPLHRADDWLLERFPRLRPLCRYVVMRMVK